MHVNMVIHVNVETVIMSVKIVFFSADNVPNSVTCAICYNELPTPWKLIQHIHKIHNLRICHNVSTVFQCIQCIIIYVIPPDLIWTVYHFRLMV